MAKWAFDLFKFDLMFWPRPSIKVQVLVDFVVECTISEKELVEDDSVGKCRENQWVMHMDSSLNANGSGVGLILTSPKGVAIQYALHFEFRL